MIKSKATEQKKTTTYPYLGASGSLIVLFTSANTGILLRSRLSGKIGLLSDTWTEGRFEKYTGKLELSNE